MQSTSTRVIKAAAPMPTSANFEIKSWRITLQGTPQETPERLGMVLRLDSKVCCWTGRHSCSLLTFRIKAAWEQPVRFSSVNHGPTDRSAADDTPCASATIPDAEVISISSDDSESAMIVDDSNSSKEPKSSLRRGSRQTLLRHAEKKAAFR
jgi:hypothetical protein